jgi:hypothetical protein
MSEGGSLQANTDSIWVVSCSLTIYIAKHFDAARGRRRRVIGQLSLLGSVGIWKKLGLPSKLNFNQYVYRVRNAKEAIEDLNLKSPCIYPVVVFSTTSQKVGPGRLTCAMAWLFCSEGCRLTNKIPNSHYGRIENSGNTCPTRAGEKRQITRLEQWRRLRLISQLVELFPLS